MLFESALSYVVIDIFKDETVKAVTEEQKKAIFSVYWAEIHLFASSNWVRGWFDITW
jgi:hypothetical protein